MWVSVRLSPFPPHSLERERERERERVMEGGGHDRGRGAVGDDASSKKRLHPESDSVVASISGENNDSTPLPASNVTGAGADASPELELPFDFSSVQLPNPGEVVSVPSIPPGNKRRKGAHAHAHGGNANAGSRRRSEPEPSPSSAQVSQGQEGPSGPSGPSSSLVCLEEAKYQDVTVLEARGKNGLKLRSRLFELGFLFQPELTNGHNFLCCVPVLDENTGEMKPCNTLLKIPKGSLGNPFRHIRRSHPEAYNAIVETSPFSWKALGKKEARDVGAGKDSKTSRMKNSQSKASLRKAVVYCAMHFLPLDNITTKHFRFFFEGLSKPIQYPAFIGTLYQTLQEQRNYGVQRMLEFVSSASEFYDEIPFLRVVIQPDFAPSPLITITYVNRKGYCGEEEQLSLITDSEELKQFCATLPSGEGEGGAHAKEAGAWESQLPVFSQDLESIIKKIFHSYELHKAWKRIASYVILRGRGKDSGGASSNAAAGAAGDDAAGEEGGHSTNEFFSSSLILSTSMHELKSREDFAAVEKYLNPRAGELNSVEMKTAKDHLKRIYLEGAAVTSNYKEAIEDEFAVYEELRNKWNAQTVGVSNYWSRVGPKKDSRLKILFKLACSLQVAYPSEKVVPVQTPRDVRIIENNDFLSEDYRKEPLCSSKEVKAHILAILFIKYNASLFLS